MRRRDRHSTAATANQQLSSVLKYVASAEEEKELRRAGVVVGTIENQLKSREYFNKISFNAPSRRCHRSRTAAPLLLKNCCSHLIDNYLKVSYNGNVLSKRHSSTLPTTVSVALSNYYYYCSLAALPTSYLNTLGGSIMAVSLISVYHDDDNNRAGEEVGISLKAAAAVVKIPSQ